MIKKRLTKKQKLMIIVLIVCGLLAMVVFLLKLEDIRNVRNRDLMRQASRQSDITICNQIIGGRRGPEESTVVREPARSSDGIIHEADLRPVARDEAGLKDECRKNAQRDIDRRLKVQDQDF